MNKIIKYDNEAREGIIKGIDTVADIVKTTVGPKGRNVLIREQLNIPIITNDGVSIAKAIQLKDNIEDAGASLIISAANKTNNIAGDGTTTTTILAQSMIHHFYKECTEKINPVQTQKEMLQYSKVLSDYLLQKAQPVKDITDIEKVATISSGNEVTGKLIAKAFQLAGDYGSVIVEDSKTGQDEIQNIQGMKLTNGTVSPYLLNDRVNLKSDVTDVNILVTTDKIDSASDLLPILDMCLQQNRKLLIICDEIEFEPLNMIIMNKAKGAPLNVSIIRLPGFGQLREDLLEDICLATGATLMGRDNGITLKDFDVSYLGEVEQIIVSMDDTIIKFKDEGKLNYKAIREQRCEELTNLMNNVEEDQKEQYRRRISNLLSGISVLKIGGNSEVEIKDKKLRIEDALNSVQAAKEEGIISGGGYSFIQAYLDNQSSAHTFGELVILNSLLSVTYQIAQNSGFDGAQVVTKCLQEHKGFNAVTEQFEDLLNSGVINSVKVDRYSLINAISVAATVITMGGLIVDENEPDSNVLQLQAPITSIM